MGASFLKVEIKTGGVEAPNVKVEMDGAMDWPSVAELRATADLLNATANAVESLTPNPTTPED